MVTLASTDLGAPRTETRIYGSGRRAPALPDIDLATPRELYDAMMQLASDVLTRDDMLAEVCRSEPHVRELCRAIERLDVHDAGLGDQLHELEAKLSIAHGIAERAVKSATEAGILRAAALADAEQQRRLAIKLSAENRELRLAALRADGVVVDVAPLARLTGYSAPDGYDATELQTLIDAPIVEDDEKRVVDVDGGAP